MIRKFGLQVSASYLALRVKSVALCTTKPKAMKRCLQKKEQISTESRRDVTLLLSTDPEDYSNIKLCHFCKVKDLEDTVDYVMNLL